MLGDVSECNKFIVIKKIVEYKFIFRKRRKENENSRSKIFFRLIKKKYRCTIQYLSNETFVR